MSRHLLTVLELEELYAFLNFSCSLRTSCLIVSNKVFWYSWIAPRMRGRKNSTLNF